MASISSPARMPCSARGRMRGFRRSANGWASSPGKHASMSSRALQCAGGFPGHGEPCMRRRGPCARPATTSSKEIVRHLGGEALALEVQRRDAGTIGVPARGLQQRKVVFDLVVGGERARDAARAGGPPRRAPQRFPVSRSWKSLPPLLRLAIDHWFMTGLDASRKSRSFETPKGRQCAVSPSARRHPRLMRREHRHKTVCSTARRGLHRRPPRLAVSVADRCDGVRLDRLGDIEFQGNVGSRAADLHHPSERLRDRLATSSLIPALG